MVLRGVAACRGRWTELSGVGEVVTVEERREAAV